MWRIVKTRPEVLRHDGLDPLMKNATTLTVWTRLAAVPVFLFFGVIAGAPLPFGSDEPISVAFWCIILGLICVTFTLSHFELRRPHLLLLSGIGLIVLFYLFVLHEQLSDHPWLAAPNPIWAQASK